MNIQTLSYVAILIFCWNFSGIAQEKSSNIVVVVGNESITKDEVFEEFFEKYPKESREVLQEIIAYRIIRQEAIAEQISVEQEIIQRKAKQELAEFQQQLGQSWQDYIQQRGINERALIQKLLRKWKYNLTMEQLVRLYEIRQTHIKIRQIVTNTREKAEVILQKLQKSHDFADIARQESLSESRFRGGEMPEIYPGDLEEPLEKVAFSLKKNEISSIVQSSQGYHIFQVLQIIPGQSHVRWQTIKQEIAESLQIRPITEYSFQRWLREKGKEKTKIIFQPSKN